MHHKLVPDFFLMFINSPKNKLQLIYVSHFVAS